MGMVIKNNNKIPLLVIAGPTATGKTEVAVEVARSVNGEIVSADSMLIYRFMDIGTAKPNMQEMKGVPHHLMDIINPDMNFTVAIFKS
jgi:tRNA dimethylallyltransferase